MCFIVSGHVWSNIGHKMLPPNFWKISLIFIKFKSVSIEIMVVMRFFFSILSSLKYENNVTIYVSELSKKITNYDLCKLHHLFINQTNRFDCLDWNKTINIIICLLMKLMIKIFFGFSLNLFRKSRKELRESEKKCIWRD